MVRANEWQLEKVTFPSKFSHITYPTNLVVLVSKRLAFLSTCISSYNVIFIISSLSW